jgi:hypothetical protein
MGIDMKSLPVEKEIHLLMAHMDKHDTVTKILAGYKLPMLVKIAAGLDEMSFPSRQRKYAETDLKDMLECVLNERSHRLNADFQWTAENHARFLLVSDQLYEAYVKGWQEAFEIAADLEKRIKRRDSFLKDYEIEIIIAAYPQISGERKTAETVAAYLGEKKLRYMEYGLSHCHYDKYINDEDFKKPTTIDKSMNWNIEYFNGEFDNDYICYPIHYMLDTLVWSFADIISIRKIWVDADVRYQHHAWIPKKKAVAEQEG